MRMLGRYIKKLFTLSLALLLVSSLLFPYQAQASTLPTTYPKLANYYLGWDITPQIIEKLAQWDIVIVSNAAYSRYPRLVKELKQHNPGVTVLVYVVSNEASTFAPTLENGNLFKDTYNIVQANNWWLYSPEKNHISTWPETRWINMSSAATIASGQKAFDWLAQEVATRYLLNGEFDGVFYDNIFDNINWASSSIDIDNDGKKDSPEFVNQKWREGVTALIETTKKLAPTKIIIGNTNTNFYNPLMNGRLHEHFPRPQAGGWIGSVQEYFNNNIGRDPKVFIINANNQNNENATQNLQKVRFTYATALLGDGFYSFTIGDKSHTSTWWYDEYNVFLGQALGPAFNITKGVTTVSPGVWRREFENGVIYVNSDSKDHTINLGNDYEKIKGVQDPSVNNGTLVRTITLKPNDGIVLQKRIMIVNDAPFKNGAFAKPYDKYGNEKERNGFFVFDRQAGGNAMIMNVDIDGDGVREKIIADGSKITIYNKDLSVRSIIYPYGASYRSGVVFDVGDVDGDGVVDIVTGAQRGHAPLVKVFDLAGTEKASFHAYAPSYKGGVNIALADLNGNKTKDIVVGAGYMGGPQVRIFNGKGALVSGGFYAYAPSFRGGVFVGAGDIDGDGVDEIITGAGIGGSTHIRMFNGKAQPLNPGIFAFSKTSRLGVQIIITDIDSDGIDEILAVNPDPFN